MKPVLLNKLDLEAVANGGWKLTSEFRVFLPGLGVVSIPKGFPTDLASARIGNWQLMGNTREAACVHDFLFASGKVSRIEAGRLFYILLRLGKIGRFKASLYALCATFTPGAVKAWHLHRSGHSSASKFLRSGRNHLAQNEP